jgi:hypothetical protein
MEFVIKLICTLFAVGTVAVTVWCLSLFTIKVWRSHVDPAATFDRIISKFQKEPTDLIATRDDDAWYQNGQVVGRVTGQITESGTSLIFEEVADTSALRRDQDIEFRRMKIRVESIERCSGSKSTSVVTATGGMSSSFRRDVISNVKCRIVLK